MTYDPEYFQKFKFEDSQKERLLESARHDLGKARKFDDPDVMFKFSYDALIKFGIFLIAKEGYRVKSIRGHHIKIIEKISRILKNPEIYDTANKIRIKRNADLYDGRIIVSEKDSKEILEFVEKIFNTPS